jgi:DNA-directed RNA polymerase subunit RPC12/RpoP
VGNLRLPVRSPSRGACEGSSFPVAVNVDLAEHPTCAECSREQVDGERGWKAYLTTDEAEPAKALVYCPECASREFELGARLAGE